jgi:hypothetical protein
VLAAGSATRQPLGYPYNLPCSFDNLLVAAHPNADEQGGNSVYFLDSRFTTENSTVVASTGNAAITAMADHHEYIVDVVSAPGESGTMTLKITLGTNGAGGAFTYSYHYGR